MCSSDLACEFDRAAAYAAIQSVRPGMTTLELSSKRGVGMAGWIDLLRERGASWRSSRDGALRGS